MREWTDEELVVMTEEEVMAEIEAGNMPEDGLAWWQDVKEEVAYLIDDYIKYEL